MMTGMAVAQALRRQYPQLELQLKWPNDLLISGKKVAGILCESSSSQRGAYVVVGLGLNCVSCPSDAFVVATSLAQESCEAISLESLRESIVLEILEGAGRLEKKGSAWLLQDYAQQAYFRPGVTVGWKNAQGRDLTASVQGLGEHGELLVQLPSGDIQKLVAEDVRAVRRGVDGSLL